MGWLDVSALFLLICVCVILDKYISVVATRRGKLGCGPDCWFGERRSDILWFLFTMFTEAVCMTCVCLSVSEVLAQTWCQAAFTGLIEMCVLGILSDISSCSIRAVPLVSLPPHTPLGEMALSVIIYIGGKWKCDCGQFCCFSFTSSFFFAYYFSFYLLRINSVVYRQYIWCPENINYIK